MTRYKINDRVEYVCRLGTIESPSDCRFNGTVEKGACGVYVGKHENKKLATEGWVLTKADTGNYVPVHLSQIRKAGAK